MRYISHVLIYRSITTFVECSIRILRLIVVGGTGKVNVSPLYSRRFIRMARFTLLSVSYFARIRMTGNRMESEQLLLEKHIFYRLELSNRFSDLYYLKIHTFYFHTATVI